MKTTELAKHLVKKSIRFPYTATEAIFNLDKKVVGAGFDGLVKVTVAALLHWQARRETSSIDDETYQKAKQFSPEWIEQQRRLGNPYAVNFGKHQKISNHEDENQ